MIGVVYKYTNTVNNKVYIGQTIKPTSRKYEHKSASQCPNNATYNSQFHTAIREFGYDNFTYEVLEFYQSNDKTLLMYILCCRERYYIALYGSYKNGYNATSGGDMGFCSTGEENGRALLTTDEVKFIRECYNNHVLFRDVYQCFKHKISVRGLQKIWYFETWKNIYPEYNTEANKQWYNHYGKANPPEVAKNNKRAFSAEQVILFRKEFDSGKTATQIKKEYNLPQRFSTIYNMCRRVTYKDI